MSSQLYNHKLLIQYLLGSLPEAQAALSEKLDELSIVDDEFAAHLQAVEAELVDAYVRRELTEPELTQFRSLYLTSPHNREKVKFAQAFQEVAEREWVARRAPASWWRRLLKHFTAPRLTLQWGLAAAVLLLFATCSWLALNAWRLRAQAQQGQAERAALQQRAQELQAQLAQQEAARSATENELARVQEQLAQERQQRAQMLPPVAPREPQLAHFDLAPQTRSLEQPPSFTLPRGVDYVIFQLELEVDDAPGYRVELQDQARRSKWKSGLLTARRRGQDKVLDVRLRARLLTPQRYLLRVANAITDGAVEGTRHYAFRVVP